MFPHLMWLFLLLQMHILCAVLLLASLVHSHSSFALNKVWEEWKIKHHKVYANQVGLWKLSFHSAIICTDTHTHIQAPQMPQIKQSLFSFQTEIIFRRTVWEKNMKLVLRHNQEASAGKHSFTLGMNHLADMVGLFSNISLSLLLRNRDMWSTQTCFTPSSGVSVIMKPHWIFLKHDVGLDMQIICLLSLNHY